MEKEVVDESISNPILSEKQDSNESSLSQDQGLKQIIIVVKELFGIAKKLAIFLLIPVIITALFGYYQGKKAQATYTAKITFFLSEERPQIPGGAAAAQLLQATNTSFSNPKKLKEYSFTEKVGAQMVFKKFVFNGREDYLANHYLRLISGYNKSYFKEFTTVKEMSIPDYLVFKQILTGIKSMVTVDYNEAEIYSISATTKNEQFSKLLCECFYYNLIDYYIERATKKAKITVDFLEEKLAYVKAQLENSEFNLADYKDKSNNLVTYKADLNETRYIRNKGLLEALYSMTATGLEASKTNLATITPLFQTIDEPHLPLQINLVSTKNQFIMYTLIGVVIDILIIVSIYFRRHFWQDFKKLLED